ncbi:sensor histidine kinase [Thermostichus vulcanus]|uniref:histidine kinase n=1 Tax=Thermostichus vulcanus str. 'Rupite' TaxID=2813851 RepID=A0ABT0CBN2_THEVL|nr:HAMP domain-containing sensor histidine kinase [Thermostichus vulcanus]MCJ2543104.1 sensor histidine kinase [Thermostichus vulcanus str. 'Rupite']
MFQSTRQRLALWYTGITAVFLLLFAGSFYWYVQATLIERVDDTLGHVVEIVERSLVVDETLLDPQQARHSLEASFRDDPSTLEDDHIDLEWFDPQGKLIWSTVPGGIPAPLLTEGFLHTARINPGYWLRQYTEPILAGHALLGYLRVSHPWFEVSKPTRQLIRDLSLWIVASLACVGSIGWMLSGLAMQPVRHSYQQLKQFTADASHELRSPLASIQTTVQVALADPQLDTDTRQRWQIVERLSLRLGRLVDDLLFLARQDSGMAPFQPRCCALDALLLQVVEELQGLAQQKGIRLQLDIADPPQSMPGDPFGFWGDENQLARLFTNLIENALLHTPAEGKVEVTLEQRLKSGAPELWVQVRDNGAGIPPESLPYVFDRFYRVDPARKGDPFRVAGSGLGLAIVKSIAEQHQGQVKVESTLGQGSTFQVILPQRQSELCTPENL